MGVGFGILKTSGSGGGGGGTTITTVANYSALPLATAVSGKFYWCEASQGTKWLPFSVGGTYYPLGMYYSNGVTWEYSETPYQATLSEVNTGTNTDKFVSPYTFTNADKWGNYTLKTTTISTTSPLQGGGDLSANRTFSITQANATTNGYLSSADWTTFNSKGNGTVTSVGLTMPTAFTVTNSPITGSGVIAVTGAGLSSQYIRGDGQLATFPTTGGGGSSVYYYLNGSINASVVGYKQLDNTAIVGVGTDISLVGNGLIAQFLTNIGNPNRNLIPSGAWNFEMFFSMSSSGGVTKFYVELLKYNGTTFTSIASTIAIPESITGGTTIDLYLTSLAVPETVLLTTDRLAVRVYIVDNSGGRTATLHTEDNHLCQITTTFSGGISSLNGLSANTQYLAVGTSGTDFNISSVTDTHTFNLPTASATNRGALSSTDWSTFNGKVGGSGTTNYLPKFTASSTIGNSLIQDNGTGVGIGTAPISGYKLYVTGAVFGSGSITLPALRGTTTGDITGTYIGMYANASASDTPYVDSTYIGGRFIGDGNVSQAYNFSLWLQDGSEGTGKFLKSVTADGKANWATLSATSPLSYNSGTKVFSIQVANATQNGYLSSTDWSTFNGKANLISPAFSGTPTAPTATLGDNSTKIATTEFVTNAVGSGGTAYGTIYSQTTFNFLT